MGLAGDKCSRSHAWTDARGSAAFRADVPMTGHLGSVAVGLPCTVSGLVVSRWTGTEVRRRVGVSPLICR